MSVFNRALRLPPTVSHDTIERYLAQLAAESQPDPLFRRRLRSDAVNRFVAVREGIAPRARTRTRLGQMGRVARACLYASFTLGVSAASVMAASQESLPGEVLYPLKQRIEELRWDVVPTELHGELAAYALGERIEEMGRLVESGAPDLAIAMAPAISSEYQRLVAIGQTMDTAPAARMERHLQILDALLDELPATAATAVENVVDGTRGIGQGEDHDPHAGNAAGANLEHGPGSGQGGGPGPTQRPTPPPEVNKGLTMPAIPKADATPKPEPAVAKPEPAVGPAPSARPHQPDEPTATPKLDRTHEAEQTPLPEQTSLPGAGGRSQGAGPPDHARNQKTE